MTKYRHWLQRACQFFAWPLGRMARHDGAKPTRTSRRRRQRHQRWRGPRPRGRFPPRWIGSVRAWIYLPRSWYESRARTVPNCTEPKVVQKCSETAPHWYTSGTVRSTSSALLPASDLGPPGNPRKLPSNRRDSSNRRPGIRTRDRQARRATRKPVRHVHKMHENLRL